jgi:hypothetical protein
MEQWLTPPLLISLAALCLSALNSYHSRKKDNKQAVDELENRLGEAEANLKVLTKQMELFWRTVEQQMAKKFKDE